MVEWRINQEVQRKRELEEENFRQRTSLQNFFCQLNITLHFDLKNVLLFAGMLHTQRRNVANLKTRKRAEVLNGIAQFEDNLITNFEEGAKV